VLYEKFLAAWKAREEEQGQPPKEPPAKSYTVPGPDGHLYYMTFDEKQLEIHRVTSPGE